MVVGMCDDDDSVGEAPAPSRLVLGTAAAVAFTAALDAPAQINERLATALARAPDFRWLD